MTNPLEGRREAMVAEQTVGPDTNAFSVSGMRNGSPVVVSWISGVLSGDPPTVDLVGVEEDLATVGQRDPLVRRSSGSAASHLPRLEDPRDALVLIRRVLDRVITITVGAGPG